jgi:uncharacterized membrane protein
MGCAGAFAVVAGCAVPSDRAPQPAGTGSATRGDSVAPPPAPAVTAAPFRAGSLTSELVALGNEPFWNITLGSDAIVYRTPDNQTGVRFPPAVPQADGTGRVWRSRRNGDPAMVEVRLASGTCSDGMSDRSYPWTVRAVVGRDSLRGCAEERPVWSDARAAFALRIPPSWKDQWEARVYDGAEAARRGSGARHHVEFLYRPTASGVAPQVLVAIAVIDRAAWDRLRSDPGPPPGELVGETRDRVWVAGLPQSNPFPPNTAAAARFDSMALTLERLRQWFSILTSTPAP